jgi:hypothetical protein
VFDFRRLTVAPSHEKRDASGPSRGARKTSFAPHDEIEVVQAVHLLAGTRAIKLQDPFLPILRGHCTGRLETRLGAAGRWHDHGFVLMARNGQPRV